MRKTARDVLAINLSALMRERGLANKDLKNPGEVAKRAAQITSGKAVKNVAPRSVAYMAERGGPSTTLHNIEVVAAVFGLQAWQLIHPTLGDMEVADQVLARLVAAPERDRKIIYQILGLDYPENTQTQGGKVIMYRKRKGNDTWHFCKNCSNWPTSGYEEKPTKPTSGEFCNECQAKRAQGNCRQ